MCTHVSELGGSVRCVLVVHVCLYEQEDEPEVTEKSHELLLARKSDAAATVPRPVTSSVSFGSPVSTNTTL